MKTDEFIDVLSTNIEPVDTRKVANRLRAAILSGLASALTSGVFVLGVRWDLQEPAALGVLLLKLVFGAAVVVLGSVLLIKYIRPGGECRFRIALIAVPFLILLTLAAISLLSAPASAWGHMTDHWLECLLFIPIIAVIPFAAITWAVRRAAPTHLVRAGALIGLVAGGVGALAYALHRTDDSVPFVAAWYSGGIVLCTLAGAVLGRPLLRW